MPGTETDGIEYDCSFREEMERLESELPGPQRGNPTRRVPYDQYQAFKGQRAQPTRVPSQSPSRGWAFVGLVLVLLSWLLTGFVIKIAIELISR
jgi:hypothetical protein